MNARTEIKIGKNTVMSVPVCSDKKCYCIKTVRKIIKAADDGNRMQAAFSYVEKKACPTPVTLDPKGLAAAVTSGHPSLLKIACRVGFSLVSMAAALAMCYVTVDAVVRAW